MSESRNSQSRQISKKNKNIIKNINIINNVCSKNFTKHNFIGDLSSDKYKNKLNYDK